MVRPRRAPGVQGVQALGMQRGRGARDARERGRRRRPLLPLLGGKVVRVPGTSRGRMAIAVVDGITD